MTYLTVININETRPVWWQTENNLEALHAIVEKSVPGDSGRVLWRVDKDAGKNGDLLVIKSDTIPDATGIVEQFGWPRLGYDEQVKTASMDRLLESLEPGQRFRFRLTVNPMSRSNGKRVPLVGDDALAWTSGKLEDSGFKILFIEQRDEHSGRLFKNGRPVFIKSSTYVGTVEIVDADSAREALVNGIGRAKAYGNGLMTLML